MSADTILRICVQWGMRLADRLPRQEAPVALDGRTAVCAITRSVVHRIPRAQRYARTVGLVGGGGLLAVFGLIVLVMDEVPVGAMADGDSPGVFGAITMVIGAVMAWMGWGWRNDEGWAISPGGVVVAERTVPWEDVGWFGLIVDDRHDDGKARQLWQLALRDNRHGQLDVSAATQPNVERVGNLSRAVAAAWLVGAPPISVPFVLAPPEHEPTPGLELLADAWTSIREGRWVELHDIGRLEGATLLPAELHGAGLEHLGEIVPDSRATLARRRVPRGRRRLEVGGLSIPLRRRNRGGPAP